MSTTTTKMARTTTAMMSAISILKMKTKKAKTKRRQMHSNLARNKRLIKIKINQQ